MRCPGNVIFKKWSPIKLQVRQDLGLAFRLCAMEISQQSWATAGSGVPGHTILQDETNICSGCDSAWL